MTYGVALNYFHYFLHFLRYDGESSYRFITSRRTFLYEQIPALTYTDWRRYTAVRAKAIGDVNTLFAVSKKLQLVPPDVDYDTLCAYYEQSYKEFFEREKIELFISGGVSGFERVGLATAQRMGIKTLCVWEGMFRPFTISADKRGMNSEASVAGTLFSAIKEHAPSKEFEILWKNITGPGKQLDHGKKDLPAIWGDKFRFLTQWNNRMGDRKDIERVRLPFHQLAASRISYHAFKHKYISIDTVHEPYIFFPLQTHTDSNIIINSDLGSIDTYLQMILSAFEQFHEQTGIRLVIKEHPMDVLRKSYQRNNGKGVAWVDPATSVSHILNTTNCLATIVINSTAGLESLLQKKPVLCLGKALYRYPEFVEIPESFSTDSLLLSLHKLVERKVDHSLVQQLCCFLYDRTQLDGNIDSIPMEHEVLHCLASLKERMKKSII